jgi:hypothetical protein
MGTSAFIAAACRARRIARKMGAMYHIAEAIKDRPRTLSATPHGADQAPLHRETVSSSKDAGWK